jgi:hypothetical protein
LEKDVKSLNNLVADLPRQIDTKLEIAYQDLRSEFSSDLKDLGTQLATEISATRTDTNTCFKNHVTTITNLSDTVLAITKNLTVLQENTLSKPDIEHLIVKKWEDELDPHNKSHYDFKAEASTCLDSLDTILQDMITTTLKSHPLLTGTTTLRSSSTRSVGFHQATSKDFSVFKLQKELKEIKLFGDTLKDLEIFWDAILSAFANLCQLNQAYPYYHDLKPNFDFKVHFVDSVKPPKYLPIDHVKRLEIIVPLVTRYVSSFKVVHQLLKFLHQRLICSYCLSVTLVTVFCYLRI